VSYLGVRDLGGYVTARSWWIAIIAFTVLILIICGTPVIFKLLNS